MPIFQESGHVPSVTTGRNISSAGGPAPGGPPPLPPARPGWGHHLALRVGRECHPGAVWGFSAGGSVHLGSGQLLQQPWSGSHPSKGTAHFTSAEPRRGAGHQAGPPWQQPRVWMGLAGVGLGGTEPRRPTGCVSGCTRPGVCFGSCGLALLGLQGRELSHQTERSSQETASQPRSGPRSTWTGSRVDTETLGLLPTCLGSLAPRPPPALLLGTAWDRGEQQQGAEATHVTKS